MIFTCCLGYSRSCPFVGASTLFFTSQLEVNDVVVSPARRDRHLTAVCSDCTVAGDNFSNEYIAPFA